MLRERLRLSGELGPRRKVRSFVPSPDSRSSFSREHAHTRERTIARTRVYARPRAGAHTHEGARTRAEIRMTGGGLIYPQVLLRRPANESFN